MVKAVVDTGAVMLVLPQDVVDTLGLETQRTVIVAYADERKEERVVAGVVTLRIGTRMMTTECMVGLPLSEPLIGHVILEELDLLATARAASLPAT
jgi:predicted aspartyl protease